MKAILISWILLVQVKTHSPGNGTEGVLVHLFSTGKVNVSQDERARLLVRFDRWATDSMKGRVYHVAFSEVTADA